MSQVMPTLERKDHRSGTDGRIAVEEARSKPPFVVGLGGTVRANSSSERALAISLRAAAQSGAETLMISGSKLALPFYQADGTNRSEEAEHVVAALRRCDGLIISAAAYHGTVSGLLKNALDYVEDLREDQRSYLDGVAVGCIACGAGWQAAVQTLTVLRTIAHSLRGWPTPFGVALNTSEQLFDPAGACASGSAEAQLNLVGQQVAAFARQANRPQRFLVR